MPMLAIVFGVALTLLGLLGYFTTGMVSWTAFIPALFGLLGSAMGVPKALTLLTGGSVARPGAAVSQAVMAVLCLVFLALCVKSFVDARRNRPQQTPRAG